MKAKTKAGVPSAAAESDFHLEDFLPYRLSVAANRVSRLLARGYSKQFGLSIPEWRVLTTIGRFGTMSPGSVGEWTAMDKVKVSRAAASLVARGLLRQSADPKDGRGRLLRMTRRGTTIHDGVVPLARELEASLIQSLGRAQWERLNRALARLNRHMAQIEGIDHGESVD